MTGDRTLLLLELTRAEAAVLQVASTDVVKRAMLAARVRRIRMRLGLAVPTGDLREESSGDERDPWAE